MSGNVARELGAHDTAVAVGPGNTAPDDTNPGATDLVGTAVNVRNALAEVEGGILGVLNALNLDERGARVQVALAALVAHDPALAVETRLVSHAHSKHVPLLKLRTCGR